MAKVPSLNHCRLRFVSPLAALIMLGATSTQIAAADCVEQPNFQEAGDGHWYYRIDRPNHHRCWYLRGESQPAASSLSEPKLAVAKVTTSISSFFAAWKSSVSNRSQQDVATVAGPPEPSADTTAVKRSISPLQSRHSASSNERAVPRVRFQQRQLEHPDQQRDLDPAQRDALFEEFLRWSLQRP